MAKNISPAQYWYTLQPYTSGIKSMQTRWGKLHHTDFGAKVIERNCSVRPHGQCRSDLKARGLGMLGHCSFQCSLFFMATCEANSAGKTLKSTAGKYADSYLVIGIFSQLVS